MNQNISRKFVKCRPFSQYYTCNSKCFRLLSTRAGNYFFSYVKWMYIFVNSLPSLTRKFYSFSTGKVHSFRAVALASGL